MAPTITAGVRKYPYLRRLYTCPRRPNRATATKRKEIPQVNNNQPRAIIKVGWRKPASTITKKPALAERRTLEYSRVPPSRFSLRYKPLATNITSHKRGIV